jgi:hypothetical protein
MFLDLDQRRRPKSQYRVTSAFFEVGKTPWPLSPRCGRRSWTPICIPTVRSWILHSPSFQLRFVHHLSHPAQGINLNDRNGGTTALVSTIRTCRYCKQRFTPLLRWKSSLWWVLWNRSPGFLSEGPYTFTRQPRLHVWHEATTPLCFLVPARYPAFKPSISHATKELCQHERDVKAVKSDSLWHFPCQHQQQRRDAPLHLPQQIALTSPWTAFSTFLAKAILDCAYTMRIKSTFDHIVSDRCRISRLERESRLSLLLCWFRRLRLKLIDQFPGTVDFFSSRSWIWALGTLDVYVKSTLGQYFYAPAPDPSSILVFVLRKNQIRIHPESLCCCTQDFKSCKEFVLGNSASNEAVQVKVSCSSAWKLQVESVYQNM